MVQKQEIQLTNSGVFLFLFKLEADLLFVLWTPWMMGGIRLLLLKRWIPGVKLDPRSVESIHLWVTLPDLGYQFWREDMLSRIVSKINKPLVTDKLTASRKRMSYLRIIVEVSADRPLKDKVVLRGPLGEEHIQFIQYEWKPWHCIECKRFGHMHGHCNGKPTLRKQ